MTLRLVLPSFLAFLLLDAIRVAAQVPEPAITITGHENVSPAADGGLRPVVGVHNLQVYRANRTAPAHRDGLTHTYLHAPCLAWWKDRFHLDYLSGPVHEHEAPAPTSYTSSPDGLHWKAPRLLFPAFTLPDGTETITHQRTSFFVAPNDRLLATAFHGKAPSPNDGTGIGRVVREIRADGTFGAIFFIRYNRHAGWNETNTPYPFYRDATDPGFVAACEAMFADPRTTMQWWEEDQSEDGFYTVKGKAFSTYRRADGRLIAVAKDAQHSISHDDGATWTRLGFARNLPVNSSKYWGERIADGRYALVFNPTTRLRHPLAVSLSDDGAHFDGLLSIHGELPDQRFPGHYKNMGPQYVRGISEGNGVPPDGRLWLTYSVNKEDIWVSSMPVPVTGAASGPVRETFESTAPGTLPATWNVYRPLWSPVQVVDAGAPAGHALELRDEDPYDYASVTRVFPAGRSVLIRFRLLPRQTDGRFEIDVAGARGERPVQIAFTDDGRIEARHEGIWMPAGDYRADEWIDVEIDVNPGRNTDRFQFRINGKEVLYRMAFVSELVAEVERITFRTGAFRLRGSGGRDLPGADIRAPLKSYLIDDVTIQPRP